MDAILCTAFYWLEDNLDEEMEPETCPIELERPLLQLQSGLNSGLPSKACLPCTKETNHYTHTFWSKDVLPYGRDSLESFYSSCESRASLGSNQGQTSKPGPRWDNEAVVCTVTFWFGHDEYRKYLRRIKMKKSFRPPSYNLATARQKLLIQKAWYHNKNNNSNEKAEMRLPTGEKAPTRNRVSKSELGLQSNSKHSYKSRRRASNRPRNTGVSGAPTTDEGFPLELPQAKSIPLPVSENIGQENYQEISENSLKECSTKLHSTLVEAKERAKAKTTQAKTNETEETEADVTEAKAGETEVKAAKAMAAETETKAADAKAPQLKATVPDDKATEDKATEPNAAEAMATETETKAADAKAAQLKTAETDARAAEPKAARTKAAEAMAAETEIKAAHAKETEVEEKAEAEDPIYDALYHHGNHFIRQEHQELTYPLTPDSSCLNTQTEITSHQSKNPSVLRDLFVQVSKFRSASEVPEIMKSQIFEELFTPFLNGGFDTNVSVLLNLTSHPGVMSDSVVTDSLEHMDLVPTPVILDLRDTERPHGELDDFGKVNHPEFIPPQLLHFTDEADTDADADVAQSHVNRDLLNHNLEFLQFTDEVEDDEKVSPVNNDLLNNSRLEKYDSPDIQMSLGQGTQSNIISGLNSEIYCSPVQGSDVFINNKTAFTSEEVHKTFFGNSFTLSNEFNFLQPPTLPIRNIRILTDEDGFSDKVLGKGCFGRVLESEMRVYPNTVQKVVVKEHFLDKSSQWSILKEAQILMFLEQTGCVPVCYGLLSNESGYWGMVSEMFGSGLTLHHLLYQKKLHTLDWLDIAHQLAICVNKIHAMDVIINDLKPDNVLVDFTDSMPVLKICDMGSASYKEAVTYNDPNMDMFQHLAPEVRAHHPTSEANDIYGIGRILMEIYYASDLSIFIPIYQQCLMENPKERITASYLIKLLTEAYTQEIKSYDSQAFKHTQSSEGREEVVVVEEDIEERMDVEHENGEEEDMEVEVEGEDEVEEEDQNNKEDFEIHRREELDDDEEVERDVEDAVMVEGGVYGNETIKGTHIHSWSQARQHETQAQNPPTGLDHCLLLPKKSVSREILVFNPDVIDHIGLKRSRSREIILFSPYTFISRLSKASCKSMTSQASTFFVPDPSSTLISVSPLLPILRGIGQCSPETSPVSGQSQDESPLFLTPFSKEERYVTPVIGELFSKGKSVTSLTETLASETGESLEKDDSLMPSTADPPARSVLRPFLCLLPLAITAVYVYVLYKVYESF